MRKKSYTLVFFILTILVIFIFFYKLHNNDNLFVLKGYKSGDTKFYKDNKLITGKDNMLHLINLDNKIDKNLNVNVNWLDTIPDENIIIYGNFNNQIGILRLDDHDNIIDHNVVIKGDDLRIDPSIIKIEDEYYFTTTKIKGAVNNADPNKENGEYTVELYKTKNLKTITKISDVVSAKNNLEDIDMLYTEGFLNIVYEKETYDHGTSDIILKRSKNKGETWGNEFPLVQGKGDCEPATFTYNENGYTLFYSSDEEDIGKSYDGAKSYYIKYDKDFKFLNKHPILLHIPKNMILYEVRKYDTTYEALYVNDYSGERNIYVDRIDKSMK